MYFRLLHFGLVAVLCAPFAARAQSSSAGEATFERANELYELAQDESDPEKARALYAQAAEMLGRLAEAAAKQGESPCRHANNSALAWDNAGYGAHAIAAFRRCLDDTIPAADEKQRRRKEQAAEGLDKSRPTVHPLTVQVDATLRQRAKTLVAQRLENDASDGPPIVVELRGEQTVVVLDAAPWRLSLPGADTAPRDVQVSAEPQVVRFAAPVVTVLPRGDDRPRKQEPSPPHVIAKATEPARMHIAWSWVAGSAAAVGCGLWVAGELEFQKELWTSKGHSAPPKTDATNEENLEAGLAYRGAGVALLGMGAGLAVSGLVTDPLWGASDAAWYTQMGVGAAVAVGGVLARSGARDDIDAELRAQRPNFMEINQSSTKVHSVGTALVGLGAGLVGGGVWGLLTDRHEAPRVMLTPGPEGAGLGAAGSW